MAEVMTTPAEAAILKSEVDSTVNYLERLGFTRGQIGATMAGIGFGLIQVNDGHTRAMEVMASVREQLQADAGKTTSN